MSRMASPYEENPGGFAFENNANADANNNHRWSSPLVNQNEMQWDPTAFESTHDGIGERTFENEGRFSNPAMRGPITNGMLFGEMDNHNLFTTPAQDQYNIVRPEQTTALPTFQAPDESDPVDPVRWTGHLPDTMYFFEEALHNNPTPGTPHAARSFHTAPPGANPGQDLASIDTLGGTTAVEPFLPMVDLQAECLHAGTQDQHVINLPELSNVPNISSRRRSDSPWAPLSPSNAPRFARFPMAGPSLYGPVFASGPSSVGTQEDIPNWQGYDTQSPMTPSTLPTSTDLTFNPPDHPAPQVPRRRCSVSRRGSNISRRGSASRSTYSAILPRLLPHGSSDSQNFPPDADDSQFSDYASHNEVIPEDNESVQPDNESGEQSLRCTIPGCGAVIKGEYRKGNFHRHLVTVHGKEKFPCEDPKCESSYKRKDARKKHYRLRHPHLLKQN